MVHIVLSLSITMMTIVVYYFKKERIKDTNLFLLGSMCLYLTIFYNFVFAPYSYLFLVPFFVLFVILYKIPIKVQNG
jgi:Ca2+/Na+ antiporter